MSELDQVKAMIPWLADPANIKAIDEEAADLLWTAAHEEFPHNACAATQSAILQEAELENFKTNVGAWNMVQYLEKSRKWTRVPVGQQEAGDIGTTCFDTAPHHGTDHVYFVMKVLNPHENMIVDNQAPRVHVRRTDGQDGKSRTTYFLRAPS